MQSHLTHTAPSHRFSHATAPFHTQLYLFGGTQEENIAGKVELADFLVFDALRKEWCTCEIKYGGSNFTLEHRQKKGYPSERSDHTCVVRHKVHHAKLRLNPQHKLIVFGGVRTISDPLSDVWEYDFNTQRWREVFIERHDVFCDPSAETTYTKYAPLIGDPKRANLYESKGNRSARSDVDYSFGLVSSMGGDTTSNRAGRSNFNPEKGIGKVFGHSCVYYEPWDCMLSYGGWRSSDIYGLFFRTQKPDIEWKMAIARWKLIRSSEVLDSRYRKSPVSRRYQSMLLYGNELVVFGGRDYQNRDRNDLWIFSLKKKVWTEMQCYGMVPPPTSNHAACLVLQRPEMLVFGGSSGSPHLHKYNFNTHIWSPIEWKSPIYPSPRVSHTMDTLNNGDIILIGGHRSYEDRRAEAWILQNEWECEFRRNLYANRNLFVDVELKFLMDDRGLEMQKDTREQEEIARCSWIIETLRKKRLKRELVIR